MPHSFMLQNQTSQATSARTVLKPLDVPAQSTTQGGILKAGRAMCACGGDCPRCEGATSQTTIQAKLKISAPGDEYEQEADLVADHVMRMPEPDFRLQRKCACTGAGGSSSSSDDAYEESAAGNVELRRRIAAQSDSGVTAPSIVYDVLRSPGSPLDASTRAFFEPRFGYDFGQVRLHTDARAAQSAQAVDALAYTVGRDVVFGAGQFSPGTASGKRLLAHELAHITQQASSLRRFTNTDLRVTGLAPELSATDNVIRFEFASAAIPAVENWKITAQATPPGRDLTLNGYTSEEGTLAANTTLADNRIRAVSRALATAGHTGPKHPNPNPTGGAGHINYRGMRIVEIVDTPVPPPLGGTTPPVPTSVVNCATRSSRPCGTSYSTAFPLAQTKIADAVSALTAFSGNTPAQLSTHFGATPPGTLITNLNALTTKLNALNSVHNAAADCHLDACDGTCASTASAYVDQNAAPHRMILCEGFVTEPDADKRADLLVHEALHATPGVMSRDIAYAHTRRIRTLTDTEKLRNTDSYVNLVRVLHDPAATISTPPSDTIAGTSNAAEHDFAQNAIDFLEQWLISAKFTSGSLYEEIDRALSTPADWRSTSAWYHFTMRDLHPIFGLTDPGTHAPFTLPTSQDKWRVAGINDRYRRMREVLYGRIVSLTKISAGTDAWASNLGSSVEVTAPFFSMSSVNAIKHLIRLMLRSMADVPASLVNNYVDGVDKMRIQNSVGP